MSTKECIACAEQIQENAKLCRFCSTLQNDERFAQDPRNTAEYWQDFALSLGNPVPDYVEGEDAEFVDENGVVIKESELRRRNSQHE